jgi:hypothetical protein
MPDLPLALISEEAPDLPSPPLAGRGRGWGFRE